MVEPDQWVFSAIVRVTPNAAVNGAAGNRCNRRACSASISTGGRRVTRCARALTASVNMRVCGPGVGDRGAAVAVPGDRQRRDPPQLDRARRDRQPPPGGVGELQAEVGPFPVMPSLQHPDHSPPGEAVQRAESVLGDGISEVVRPAVHDLTHRTSARSCCDTLCVLARIFVFSDRSGVGR